MRHPMLLVLLLLSLACSEDSRSVTDGNEPEVRNHVISGIVTDSMTGTPVAGVRLLIGDSSVVSDSFGRFLTRHRAGDFAISIQDFQYEAYSRPLKVLGEVGSLDLRLKGQAPYVTSCTFGAAELTATVIDLQGRKTVNRRSQSTTTLVSADGTYRRDANTWSWTPIDDLTWLAHVPSSGVTADSAVWRLEDADGHVRNGRCINQPPPCQNC